MKSVFLITEPDTLRVRPSGPATGNIWLEMNGQQFPMLHWNDFVVVILGQWALALSRMVCGLSVRETVHFMDGPYAVELGISQTGMLQLRALKRGLSGTDEVTTGEEPARLFIPELISQSRDVLNACKSQNWWSKDVEVLESSVKDLTLESKRLLN